MNGWEWLEGQPDVNVELLMRDRMRELARFCLVTGVPYSEALHMPKWVRDAFIHEHNKINKKDS
jgi:hypothetical protein